VLAVVRLEIPILLSVEADQNCHDLAQTQAALPLSLLSPVAEQQLAPLGLKPLAEIINMAK